MRQRFAAVLAAVGLAGSVAAAWSLTAGAAWAQASDDDICTDRPSRAAGACTVPAGHFQYEADIVSGTFQREHGTITDSWSVINPALKYGLGATSDIELQFDPLTFQRTHVTGGKDRTAASPGDLFLRFKQNVLGGNDGDVQVALVPYLKAPTASHLIGDGAWEGGGYAPITIKLGKLWQVSLSPELDVLKDDAGGGRHLQHSEVVSVSRSLPDDWTVYGDVYAQWDFERRGATQSTLDFAVAKIIGKTLQLDAGVNIGLNRATPGANAYFGVSQRF